MYAALLRQAPEPKTNQTKEIKLAPESKKKYVFS